MMFFLEHDLVFVLVTAAFFALSIAYARGIDRFSAPPSGDAARSGKAGPFDRM
ncbi:MAG TPA: hypothetical protein VMJ10_32510 [Kofleriaceae bacterium]|nr:hypothetical protein [Kofleriaceae bacterium]